MSQWYYSHDGQQKGPVPVSELSRLASAGEFDPEKDMVWREGMPDWQPAVSVEGLPFGKPAPAPVADPETAAPVPTPSEPAPAPASPYDSPAQAPGPSAVPAAGGPIETCGLAIASLVCGIAAFFTCCVWFVSIPVALGAIITGHMALSRIKAEPARLKGKGLASAGLITGYIGALLAILYGVFVFWIATRSPEQIDQMDWLPPEVRDSISQQLEMQQEMRERMEEPSEP